MSGSLTANSVNERLSSVLEHEYGRLKGGAKLLARDADVVPRTAENWLQRLHAPRLAELLRLARRNDRIREEILSMLGEQDA